MLAITLMAAAAAARADEVVPAVQPAAPDTSSIILEPKPAPAAQATPAVHSKPTGLSSEISEGMPKYEPAQVSVTPIPDMREIDKPRNQIPRVSGSVMARYLVRGDRVPVFRKRDLYTTSGLIDLSFKEHPGLRIGNIFGLNSAVAYEMYLEEDRLEKIKDLDDTALAMAVGGDSAEARMILEATGDAYIRNEDFSGPVGIK